MSKILNSFFKKAVKSKGLLKGGLRVIRSVLVRVFGDPSVSYVVRGHNMLMPLSHELPFYVEKYPFYDSILTRVAAFLRRKKEYIKYIDVGANIGDTIVAIDPKRGDSIVGIEPEPKFNYYIKKNLGEYLNINILNILCSSSTSNEAVRIKEKAGTASLVIDKNSSFKVKRKTIDQIVKEIKTGNIDFLKIDTDGHDFNVLKGASQTLNNSKPVIFFECDFFSNKDYLKDASDLFTDLINYGYKSALIYSNVGYLIEKINLSDKKSLHNLLIYQLMGGVAYFDILVMKEEDMNSFESSEVAFFGEKVKDKLRLNI